MEWLFENQRTGLKLHFVDDQKSMISIRSVDDAGNPTRTVEGVVTYGFDSAGRRSLGLIEVNPRESRGLGIGSAAMWCFALSAAEYGGANGATGEEISLVNADPGVRTWYGQLGFYPDPERIKGVADEVTKLSEEHEDKIANMVAKNFLIPQVMMIAETRNVIQSSSKSWSKNWNVIGNSAVGNSAVPADSIAERLNAAQLADPAPAVQQGATSNPQGPHGEGPQWRNSSAPAPSKQFRPG